MTRPTEISELPARPLAETSVILLLAWMIPGLGHVLRGDARRGVILFVTVQVTFGLGLMLHGAVLWPAINARDWGFNAVNILTFVVQIGNGLASLLCLAVSQNFPEWAEATRAGVLFELGSVYLLISGAANIYSVGGVFDRHLRRGRPAPAEGGA